MQTYFYLICPDMIALLLHVIKRKIDFFESQNCLLSMRSNERVKKWNWGKNFPAYCSKIYCTSLGVKYGLFLSPVFGVGIFSFQSEDILYSFWR